MTTVWYRGDVYSPSDAWVESNWVRPFAFLASVEARSEDARVSSYPYLYSSITSGFELRRALTRRSLTSAADSSVPFRTTAAVLRAIYDGLGDNPSLFCGLATMSAQGWSDGCWLVEHAPRRIIRTTERFDPEDLRTMIQGQGWAAGAGLGVAIGINWTAAAGGHDDADVAYADALIAVGRLGHALLLEASRHGLVGRMTPAVHESTAARLFALDDRRDVLYYLRLGRRAMHPSELDDHDQKG